MPKLFCLPTQLVLSMRKAFPGSRSVFTGRGKSCSSLASFSAAATWALLCFSLVVSCKIYISPCDGQTNILTMLPAAAMQELAGYLKGAHIATVCMYHTAAAQDSTCMHPYQQLLLVSGALALLCFNTAHLACGLCIVSRRLAGVTAAQGLASAAGST